MASTADKQLMALNLVPKRLRRKFCFAERHHACGILASDFSDQWRDILDCLDQFWLKHSWIIVGGGGRSLVSVNLDRFFRTRNWAPKQFDIRILVDGQEYPTPTHHIDNVKNRVGLEVEWNNKTEFYDRDLNNFRMLHELKVLSVGVILTRVSELQSLFNRLSIGSKYGASTTHWDKLIPKVDGNGGGGCPLLLVGITEECYRPNE